MEFKKIMINDREYDVVTSINQEEIESNDNILYDDTIDLSDVIKNIKTNVENKDE